MMLDQLSRRSFLRGSLLAAASAGTVVALDGLLVTPVVAADNSLTFVISRDVENLDPHSTGAWQSNMVRELIYDNLVDWDATGVPIPGLAEKWETSADGLTYTFHLRAGAKFHDGTPVDAAAVKASFDRLLAPDRKTAASGQMNFITGVALVDPATLAITTKGVNPLTLQYLGTGLAAVVSPADIAAFGAKIIDKPVGSGPYKFVEWSQGDKLVVAKNPDYWSAPGFEQAIMKAAPEASVRLTAVTSGEVQLAELIAPTDYPAIKGNAGLKLIPGGGARFVYFNLATTQGPTADLKVRLALNYAIDKQSIITSILGGQGTIPDSPVSKLNVGYHAVGTYDYDPDKAASLLAEANYDKSQTLQAIYPTSRYYYAKEISEAVQAMLGAVGVKVAYTAYPDMTQYNDLEKGLDKLNMAYTSFYPSVMDADSALYIRYRTGLFLNYNYTNPVVDTLLDEGQTTFDQSKRDEIYAKAQTLIWNDAPFLALYYQTVNSAATANLNGVKYYPNERLSVKWASFKG